LDTFKIHPLRRFYLNTLDFAKQPTRIFLNQEARFKADCNSELHRSTYGRPWNLGSHFFDFMLAQGLKTHHKVLDFGCGSGRLGIHLINYLDAGCYFGIESHYNSLRAFAHYEIPKARLESKGPRLLLDREFNFHHFDVKFDQVIETSVTQHIYDDALIKKAYTHITETLNDAGDYFVSPRLRLSKNEMHTIGLTHMDDLISSFELYTNTEYESNTYWSRYKKNNCGL